VYEDGTTGSQSDCESNPPDKYLIKCPGTKALTDESSPVSNIFTKALAGPGTSPKGLGDMLCFKGTADVNGKKHVERGCIPAHKEEDLNGKCEDLPDQGNIKKIKGCWCNSNKCNSGVSLVSLPILTIGGLGLLTAYLKF